MEVRSIKHLNYFVVRCHPRNWQRSGIGRIKVLLALVALVTVLIFSVIHLPVYGTPGMMSNHKAAATQVFMFESAVDMYYMTTMQHPSGLIDLLDPPRDPKARPKWLGPYLDRKRSQLIDPWGAPYQYVVQGFMNKDRYDVWSLGPDGHNGTEDDIGNWDEE